MHVVWDKFCRYFDVEPQIVPLQEGKYTIGPEDVEPLIDENTIGVAAVLGTTFTGHADDIVGINELLVELRTTRASTCRCTSTAPRGGFVWPFLYPDSEWDFRLEQVRSINVSGHKFGLVYPASAGSSSAESDLAEDLVFYENYLGDRRDLHAQLLHRRLDGAGPVLQLRPPRPRGLRLHHEGDAAEHRRWPRSSKDGNFELIRKNKAELHYVAFKLAASTTTTVRHSPRPSSSSSAGSMLAYTMPPKPKR